MKKILVVGGLAILFGLLMAGLWQQGWLGNSEKRLFNQIKDKPELVALFEKIQKTKADIKNEPEKVSLYFDLGFYWKSIAELGGGEPFFKKSLKAYELGIEKFGQKNILFYLNGGKLAERLEYLDKAERYYKKAIEISSADESGYLYLVDLYSYKMNKPKDEVLKIFEDGIKKMVVSTPLIAGRAAYLRRIDEFAMALDDYKLLSQTFPNNQGYKDVIQELEQAIKK